MFNGLTAADLSSMPPFPFPKELFPADTFPPGVQFADESLKMLPPSVRELVETGQAGSLGLMFETSTEQLEPGLDSFLSLLMGGNLPGSKSNRSKAQPHGSHVTLPTGIAMDAISENFEFLSSCTEEELMEKLMRGELDLGDLGLGGIGEFLKCFDTQTSSETGSESGKDEPEPEQSDSCTAEAADAVSDVESVLSGEGGCGGTVPGPGNSNGGAKPTILIQEIREGDVLAFEASKGEQCSGRGVKTSTIPLSCHAVKYSFIKAPRFTRCSINC